LGRSCPGTPPGAISGFDGIKAGLQLFVLTGLLDANRHPSSGQARGHASLENAIRKRYKKETGQEDRRKVTGGVGPSHIFGALKFSMGALSM
jgi:hypothetical protein